LPLARRAYNFAGLFFIFALILHVFLISAFNKAKKVPSYSERKNIGKKATKIRIYYLKSGLFPWRIVKDGFFSPGKNEAAKEADKKQIV